MKRILNSLLITFSLLFIISAHAQPSQGRMLPRDAKNNALIFGLGNPYASTITVTASTYVANYTLPTSGLDANRVYRHLYAYNPDANRTVYVCFGDSTGCSTDSYIIRPGYGLVFEPLLFGAPVGSPLVYFRLDASGSVNVDLSAW